MEVMEKLLAERRNRRLPAVQDPAAWQTAVALATARWKTVLPLAVPQLPEPARPVERILYYQLTATGV